MRLLFNVKNRENVEIKLIKNKRLIDKTNLTVGQDFDTVLIRELDKILHKNIIEKLSLKSVQISGEMTVGALSSMILKATTEALII